MAPDEVMVYSAMAVVPAVAGLACFLLLRAVHRRSMSVLVSCVVFSVAVLSGMFLSFGVVLVFADLLHGDGALAIIAAPITGAILTAPIALVFAFGLVIISSRRATRA